MSEVVIRHSIVVNRARCNRCGDEILSQHKWDYTTCSCGYLSVDGGRNYLKRATRDEIEINEAGERVIFRDFEDTSIITKTYSRRGLLLEAYSPEIVIHCTGPDMRQTIAQPQDFVVYEPEGGATAWTADAFWANHELCEERS